MAEKNKVEITIEAKNETQKVFEQIQQQIRNLSKATSKALNNLSVEVSKSAEQMANASYAMNRLATSLGRVRDMTEKTHPAFRSLVWTIVRAEIVYRGIMRIVDAFTDTLAYGINVIDEYNTTLLQLASIQTTAIGSLIHTRQEAERTFDIFYEQSKRTYRIIEDLSIQTPLTADQLVRLYRAWLSFGQNVDLTNEKVRRGLLAVANAIYMVTGGFQVNRQLIQETRGLILQTGLLYSDLARYILQAGLATKEQLRTWAQQGELLQHMADILIGFDIGAERVMNMVRGLTTTFVTQFNRMAREAFKPLYDGWVGFLSVLTKSPVIMEQIRDMINSFVVGVKMFASALMPVIQTLNWVYFLIKAILSLAPAFADFFVKVSQNLKAFWRGEVTFGEVLGKSFKSSFGVSFDLIKEELKTFAKSSAEVAMAFGGLWLDNVTQRINQSASKQYEILQRYTLSTGKLATEFEKNIEPLLQPKTGLFGVKTIENYRNAVYTFNLLQKQFNDFVESSKQLAKSEGFALFDRLVNKVLAGDTREAIDNLRQMSKQMGMSQSDYEAYAKILLLIDARHKKIQQSAQDLQKAEANLTSLFEKEMLPKLTSYANQVDIASKKIKDFGVFHTILDKKISQVNQQYLSLKKQYETLIVKGENYLKTLRDVARSDIYPASVRQKAKAFARDLEQQIEHLKSVRGQLDKGRKDLINYYTEAYELSQKNIQITRQLTELRSRYVSGYITEREYLQGVLPLLEQQKLTYQSILQILPIGSQEYETYRRQLERVEEQIRKVNNTLKEYNGTLLEGATVAINQYISANEKLVSAFGIAKQIITSALTSMESALTAVFGDLMLGRLKSFKDYFMLFAEAIVRAIAQIIAKLLVLKVLIPAIEKLLNRLFSIGQKTDNLLHNVARLGLSYLTNKARQYVKSGGALSELSAKVFGKDSALRKVVKTAQTGVLGATAYSTIGKAIGLPQSTSAKIGSAIGTIGGVLGASALGLGTLGTIALGGLGAIAGGLLGGLFGGGKHHPGKYGWRFEWGGIHINPETGEVYFDYPKIYRTWRAGKRQNKYIGLAPVGSFIGALQRQLMSLPLETRKSIAGLIEQVNRAVSDVEYTVHLEALRQQQKALDTIVSKYYVPALRQRYAKLFTMLGYTPQFQQGGVIKAPLQGAYVGAVYHGTEHIIPDTKLADIKKELSNIRELLFSLLTVSSDQMKHNKKTASVLQKWDILGLPQGA